MIVITGLDPVIHAFFQDSLVAGLGS